MNCPILLAVSKLLKGLPENGVGLQVARDTWHPLSGRFWEIVKVEPKKVITNMTNISSLHCSLVLTHFSW
jgi:hypothetical protein